MTTVYIVCGAGASSTFLALSLRNIMGAESGIEFVPAPLSNITPTGNDIVAVAHHIAVEPRVEELRSGGITILELPEHVNGAFGAADAATAISAALTPDFVSHTTQETQA